MEEPLDRFRSSTLGWLRGTLAGWGTVLIGIAGIAAAIAGPWGAYPLLLTGLALAILLVVWFGNLAASYEISADRLLIRRGIFMKSIDEVELYRVKDVRLDFSLVNQMAGIGTLCITSSDETTRGGALLIRHIERALPRREALRRLVDDSRRRRGVRELDMSHDHL